MRRTADVGKLAVSTGSVFGASSDALPFAQPLMQAVQCAAHAVSRQRVHVIGLGLVEKLGYVGGRDGVVVEARFESLSPKVANISNPGMNATSNHDTRVK